MAISFFVGATYGKTWSWSIASLALLFSAGYCIRVPFLAWIQRKRRDAIPWFFGYLLLILLTGFTLLWHPQRQELLVTLVAASILFAVNLWLTARRMQRSVLGEFMGVIGLTFVAVLAYYAAEGTDARRALLLWLLNALYFGSSIFYVKLRVEQHVAERRSQQGGPIPYRRRSLVYHLCLLVCLVVLTLTHTTPPLIFLAFTPLLMRGWIQIRQVSLSIRQLGFCELGMGIAYAAGMVLCLGG